MKGGGASLGIIGLPEVEGKFKSLTVKNVPSSWGPATVKCILKAQDWKIAERLTPPRRSTHGWLVGGVPPEGGKDLYVYEVKHKDKEVAITVELWNHGRRNAQRPLRRGDCMVPNGFGPVCRTRSRKMWL